MDFVRYRSGMGRKRIYANAAERLAAWRARQVGQSPPPEEDVVSMDEVSQPAGWDLILYIDKYVAGKPSILLANLAKERDGVDVLWRVAEFFQNAVRQTGPLSTTVQAGRAWESKRLPSDKPTTARKRSRRKA